MALSSEVAELRYPARRAGARGVNLLHVAAVRGKEKACRVLLKYGADPLAVSNEGDHALR